MQQTLAKEIKYSGIALHTGKEVNITCLPADSDTGIVFRRIDLPDSPEIKAIPVNVVSTKRCTSIGVSALKDCVVHTIEHIMAALWALEIDNLIIEIDNAETPVADGSAIEFINLFKEVDTFKLEAIRQVKKIEEPICIRSDDMYLIIMPYDGFKLTYTMVYDHPVIATQFYEYEKGIDNFIKEIAPARTFGFKREVEALHRRGLALGGSLENAVLIGEEKTINPLRFSDEFVRHKILDLAGDMFLNAHILGHIIAVRSGHYLHVELAKNIAKKY